MYVVSLWSLYGDKETMDNISIVLELQKEDGAQGGFTIKVVTTIGLSLICQHNFWNNRS